MTGGVSFLIGGGIGIGTTCFYWQKQKTQLPKKIMRPQVIQDDCKGKEEQLNKLLEQAKNKINQYEKENKEDYDFPNYLNFLDELLDSQRTLTIYQNSPNINARQVNAVQKRLIEVRNNLLHIIIKEELDEICQAKSKLVRLETNVDEPQSSYQAKIETTP